MQIYALALEKGGVGKTCLAVNLAAAFSRLNLRALLIDLDAQAHATHWLGLSAAAIRPEDSVLGILNGRALSDCVRTTNEGVEVQPEDLVMRALQALAESVGQAQRVNPQLRGMSIVRNRYAPRSAGDQIYDQLLREAYRTQLLKTIIPVRAALRDSAGLQQSIFRYNGPDANEVRNVFLDLVEELIVLDGA